MHGGIHSPFQTGGGNHARQGLVGALIGIDAYPVEVEVDIAQGLPQFATVGLPEGAVKESKDRIKSAIKNSGYEFPARRITINLAPADIRKDGAAFDLPMAIGLLAATGRGAPERPSRYLVHGRTLPGRPDQAGARPRCRWPSAPGDWGVERLAACRRRTPEEGAIVEGLPVYGVHDLGEVVEFLTGETHHRRRAEVDPPALFRAAAGAR